MVSKTLPSIYIDIQQPGDKGNFLVRAYDSQTKKLICQNQIKEERSYFEYIYTARLLEGGGMGMTIRDESQAESHRQDRYKDLIRYGQRLYNELFGTNKQFKQYLEKSPHLKDGARLLLRLHNTASELWNIPWEYMHDGQNFIATDKRYPIIRSLIDSGASADINDVPNPLRVLMVISTPRDAAPLNVEAEIANMRLAVAEAESAGRLQIDFIESGRLEDVEAALVTEEYHILHYSGHGAMSSLGSLLVMENEHGLSQPVFLKDLLPIIERAQNLRFVFLSACRTGNVRETEAMNGIATGLLQHVPAVLAMQFSIRDDRAALLSQAFYGSLGRGASLEDALSTARLSMNESNQLFGDWGIPTLYLQKPNLRLLDTKTQSRLKSKAKSIDLSALPANSNFVGRRHELRLLRNSMANPKIALTYLWGMAGFGKTALLRQVLERQGNAAVFSDILLLNCEKLDTDSLFASVLAWFEQHFPKAKPILDKLPQFPDKAVQALAQHVRDKRFLLVFDRLDVLMRPRKNRQFDFADTRLSLFFAALAQANWSVHCIATSRFRWEKLDVLSPEKIMELHLGAMSIPDVAFFFQALPEFKALSSDDRNKLFSIVGGHPQSLLYLHEAMKKNSSAKILSNTNLSRVLSEYWQKRFLETLFRLISPEELAALRLLSIHRDVFNPRHVQLMAGLSTIPAAEALMIAWESLSLASHIGQGNDGTTWYEIPLLVQTYVNSQITADEERQLHAQVAKVITEGFVLSATQRFEDGAGPEPKANDPLGTALTHVHLFLSAGHENLVNRYLGLSYTWQEHYRKGGDFASANRIAFYMMPLYRSFGAIELLRKLYDEMRPNLSQADGTAIRYWQSILFIEDKKYQDALKVLSIIEKAIWDKTALRALYAATLEAQGEIFRNLRKDEEAYKKYRTALGHYDILKDSPAMMRLRLYLGEAAYYNNDVPQARQHIETALQIYQNMEKHLSNPRVLGQLLLYRGHLQRDLTADFDAIKSYGAVFSIGRDIGDLSLIARALENMAHTYGLLRQYHLAGQQLIQAMDIYEKLNDMASLSLCLTKLAAIQFWQNNRSEALPLCERALRLAKEHAPANIAQSEALLKKIKGWKGLFQ